MGIVQKQQFAKMGQGNGYLRIGGSLTSLQDVGALEGNATVVTVREVLQAFDGQPQILVKEEVLKEMARATFTLKEKTLEQMARQLGYVTTQGHSGEYGVDYGIDDSYVNETVINNVTELKYLYDPDSWAHLNYRYILKSPAPTAHTADPTPLDLVVGDIYEDESTLDLVIYKGAIRRVANGNVDYGGGVYITYSAVRPSTLGIHTGGLNLKQFFVAEFTYEQTRDTRYPKSGGRQITRFPRAYPSPETQEQYNAGAWNIREFAFDAVGDLTLPEGQRLIQRWHEEVMSGSDPVF